MFEREGYTAGGKRFRMQHADSQTEITKKQSQLSEKRRSSSTTAAKFSNNAL
jgi:hypothetical protein